MSNKSWFKTYDSGRVPLVLYDYIHDKTSNSFGVAIFTERGKNASRSMRKGVIYSSWNSFPSYTPDDPDSFVYTDVVGDGNYDFTISGLQAGQEYIFRPFAINNEGIGYGDAITTYTLGDPSITIPTVTTTSPPTELNQSYARITGSVTNNGGGTITGTGICYSQTNPTPTMSDTTSGSYSGDSSSFISNAAPLNPNTLYYARAFAINSAGIGLGNIISFTTPSSSIIGKPVVNTESVYNIGTNTASGGGYVVTDGGAIVTARGIVWSTSSIPDNFDINSVSTKTSDGVGIGGFGSLLTSLILNTFYYVRAYAINSQGLSFGNEVTFTTKVNITPILQTYSGESIQYQSYPSCPVVSINIRPSSLFYSYSGTTTTSWSKLIIDSVTSNLDGDGYNFLSAKYNGSVVGSFPLEINILGLSSSSATGFTIVYDNPAGSIYNNIGNQTLRFTYRIMDSNGLYTSSQSYTVETSSQYVSMGSVNSVTATTAILRIISYGSSISDTGYVIKVGTTPPTLSDSRTSVGIRLGNYDHTITGLTPNTTYTIKSYNVVNNNTHLSSVSITFTTD